MAAKTDTEAKRMSVVVASDRLSATVQPSATAGTGPLTPEEVLEALKAQRVLVDEKVQARVAAFLEQVKLAQDSGQRPEPFVVVRGLAPQEGKDEKFIWDPSFDKTADDWQGDAPINYYSFNSIITVEAGTVIGSLEPLVPARNGLDVLGEVIRPKTQPRAVQLHDTVGKSPDDPTKVVAKVAGRVIYKDMRLSIEEVLVVAGDVDFSCGNIDSHIDVSIKGMVCDRFKVKSTKSVAVGGAIEAATVGAGAEVVVRGGILARNQGRVEAGTDIVAKFANEARLHAGGDIKVTKELINCRARAERKVVAEHAAIIGGYIYGKEGVDVGTLGSDAHVATRIVVGVHPAVLKEMDDLDGKVKPARDAIAKIRESVKPLLENMRRLTPAQREQATELLFRADEAEANIVEAEKRRQELLKEGQTQTNPRVRVMKMLYPGVRISFGRRATAPDKPMKGPISIEQRKIENATEIVAVNQLTGSVQVLQGIQLSLSELVPGFVETEDQPTQPPAATPDSKPKAPPAGRSKK
ncbi:MAG TPA: FapA family protein [Phycisphaerae bacterium]|nr:FapA family protein [Phycisphaerae bacterium]HNU44484.1 FapA family protein [Phycisphaerae bacterium]